MEITLSPQQVAALKDCPDAAIPVVDGSSRERYVLLPEQLFLKLSDAATGPKNSTELRQLIDEGIASPSIPADEAFEQLRRRAAHLAGESE